jgi:UDP-N-acetylglucosamine acyltransferase
MPIHPTAIVDPHAELDSSAEVGPYAIIDAHVRIGENAKVMHHAYVTGWTEIGAGCVIHPFAVVGHVAQHVEPTRERSFCRIGAGTIIREHATVHRGLTPESETVLGQKCLLLVNAHVAHDCRLGDGVQLINNVALGGHVTVGDRTVFGGGSNVHQHVRIGEGVMFQGMTASSKDVPPFLMVAGFHIAVGINVIGMRRAGFTPQDRQEVKEAYKMLYRSGQSTSAAIEKIAAMVTTEAGKRFVGFLRVPTKRGICKPPGAPTIWADREGTES